MLIGLVGKIGSGKDTVAGIIQELFPEHNWQIKKFAGKLKQVASILTGIPVEDFEKQEVKESFLGPEWDYTTFGKKVLSIKSAKQECASDDWPWKEEYRQNMAIRILLQRIGTDAMRDNVHENVWVNALMADYVPVKKEGGFQRVVKHNGYPVDFEYEVENPNWLVTDVRFPNEAEAIEKRNGVIVRVERMPNPYPESGHISETALDHMRFPTIINHGTLDELREVVKHALQKICNEA